MIHLIEVTKKNRDIIVTRINGEFDEIINYYKGNNDICWRFGDEENQIAKINFLDSPLLKNTSKLVYLFVDYNNTGLLA